MTGFVLYGLRDVVFPEQIVPLFVQSFTRFRVYLIAKQLYMTAGLEEISLTLFGNLNPS